MADSTTSSSPAGAEAPSYPPTEVRRWFTCPVFRNYSKKWEPRATRWRPHAAVGTGIHAAIAEHLNHVRIDGLTYEVRPSAISAGIEALGSAYEVQDTYALDGLEKLVTKGYKTWLKGIEEEGLLVGTTILGVEMVDPFNPVPPSVRVPRTLDAVLERDGQLEVWDWKTKMRLDEQYVGETMRAALHQWQLLDYAWHVQEWERKGHFPGGTGRPVSRAAWGLVILAPATKFRPVPVALTPERLDRWHAQAQVVWRQMASGVSWMNMEACTDRHLHFGSECAFLPACHQLNGNESLFEGIYRLKESESGDAE